MVSTMYVDNMFLLIYTINFIKNFQLKPFDDLPTCLGIGTQGVWKTEHYLEPIFVWKRLILILSVNINIGTLQS